jgi:hypothetical protein
MQKNLLELNINNALVINSDILDLDINILDMANVFYLFNLFVGKVFSKFYKNIVNLINRKNREV